MKCSVYRSDKKPDTYLYLLDSLDYQDLPADLQQVFGEALLVMDLQLSAERKLAQVDVARVMQELATEGYFLQLPPKIPTEELITGLIS
jgi:uncharacterized protein YcgL (UPF0745 family)